MLEQILTQRSPGNGLHSLVERTAACGPRRTPREELADIVVNAGLTAQGSAG